MFSLMIVTLLKRPFFFDVVITEPTELKLSRDRWRAYKTAGVELAAYDRRK